MSAYYDSYDYLSYWEGRTFEDCCERIALAEILKSIGKKNSLVDIGGGFGRLAGLYSPYFQKCIILDPSEKLLEIGRKKTEGLTNISFIKGSLPKLPLRDKSFDVVLVVRVSHHLSELSPCFREIRRISKDNSYLILEVANKIHFLARVRAFLTGNFSFTKNWEPVERRCPKNINQGSIAFLNHHPQKVINDLERSGFVVKIILSVSNFRSPLIKNLFPHHWLFWLESHLQKPLARFFFGPSIFILAQEHG